MDEQPKEPLTFSAMQLPSGVIMYEVKVTAKNTDDGTETEGTLIALGVSHEEIQRKVQGLPLEIKSITHVPNSAVMITNMALTVEFGMALIEGATGARVGRIRVYDDPEPSTPPTPTLVQ